MWEQVLISTAGPPIIAVLWRLRARGWARTVQGGTVSEKTERRQKKEFLDFAGCAVCHSHRRVYLQRVEVFPDGLVRTK